MKQIIKIIFFFKRKAPPSTIVEQAYIQWGRNPDYKPKIEEKKDNV